MPSALKRPRPRRQRSPDSDSISARESAGLLDKSYPTQFNLERETRQLVLDPVAGLLPYPARFRRGDLDDDDRVEKEAFDRAHHLVVIEWGGTKPPRGIWSYSRRQCADVAARGILAELEARAHAGLRVVSPELGGPKHRSGGRPKATADQENAGQSSEAP